MSEKVYTGQEARDEAIRAANQLVIRQSHKIHAEHAAHCDGECFKNAGYAAVMTIVELTRERDAAMRANDAMAAAVNAIAEERDALRAIIEGRTVPPTDAEIAAHAAAGGVWLVRAEWREGRQSIDFVQSWAPRIAKLLREYNSATWWMALDATHMPCGWPTTEAPDAR